MATLPNIWFNAYYSVETRWFTNLLLQIFGANKFSLNFITSTWMRFEVHLFTRFSFPITIMLVVIMEDMYGCMYA